MIERFREWWQSRNQHVEIGRNEVVQLRPPGQVDARTMRAGDSGEAYKRRGGREFVVIGLGRFGTSLARSLVDHGHDVLAIDADYKRVQALSSDLPHVVQVDATNLEALRELGVEHFDTGIVCIGENFEANILATVLLRKLRVRRVICKARTRTQREILLQVGADEVILPEHEAGVHLARRLSAVDFVDYLELGPGMVLVEMVAPERLHGQTLAEADLRRTHKLTVLAIRRGDKIELNPPAEARILAGDELLVAGRMADAERLSD